ncbi:hypothetical protein TWF718_010283 [Orbilia javanica]|uniref:Uncharacterized protein n=1 Tax=Orbilia javanica TaxID=47235 RepID=A0AAN8MRJ1_9PEZI
MLHPDPQTQLEDQPPDLKTFKEFINTSSISIDEVASEYRKISDRFENGTSLYDKDEDIMETDTRKLKDTELEESKEYTTSEIDEIFRSTQDEIIDALKNDKPLSPEVEELIDEIRNRISDEYEEDGTIPETEEGHHHDEKAKPSTSKSVRSGHAPFGVPAPLYPNFDAAFHALPLDIAAMIVYQFIINQWAPTRVSAAGQNWYQLIRIVRAADVHAAYKRINRPLRIALPVASPMERLKSWARSNTNYWRARGVASPNQVQENATTLYYVGVLCRILMNPMVSIACPFCGVHDPNVNAHNHVELRLIVKLFLQRQYRYVDPVVLWDARTPEAMAVFTDFKRWLYQWKRLVEIIEPRHIANLITKTISLSNACRADAVFDLIRHWRHHATASRDWLTNSKAVITGLWDTYRSSAEIYMGFPVAGPSRRGRSVSYRRIDLWPGEMALGQVIDDQLVSFLGTVPSTAANQNNMGIRGRGLELPYANLKTTRLPPAELPPLNATWGHAYTTEQRWHHFYSNYPLDPNAGSSLAG